HTGHAEGARQVAVTWNVASPHDAGGQGAQVELAVGVEVADRQGHRAGSGGDTGRRLECAVSTTEENAHIAVGCGDVHLAVGVEVANREGENAGPGGGVSSRLKRAVGVAQQHADDGAVIVGDGEVQPGVVVEVGGRDGLGVHAGEITDRR